MKLIHNINFSTVISMKKFNNLCCIDLEKFTNIFFCESYLQFLFI